ncbi:hypothetical protein [Deinococcus cellulosilyticus]|uniref:Uncharacterized protein n=1 Tax=Deinococcus cellulosilyticus (strain DSM 18568 / NBRC 106333 / KACC 11606 / 5516J-15) TaxID=1223518 RepID=A0A511N6T2_DEIC1|nr:hypothetical protein [Deinococcus cellulosilyticus]GEM48563.1 hypothetical protein DC3_41980 [Deinococcus cellulosilyticus NBRC 106333 = KACC 11606]
MRSLRFGLCCALLGALSAWLGLKFFPTQAGFIAAPTAREMVVWSAAGVLGVLGAVWSLSGVRKSSLLEGILLALIGVPLVSLISLLFWWGPEPYTFSTAWVLGWDMLLKTWWLLILMGLGAHWLRRMI